MLDGVTVEDSLQIYLFDWENIWIFALFFKGELKAHIHISLYESDTLQE